MINKDKIKELDISDLPSTKTGSKSAKSTKGSISKSKRGVGSSSKAKTSTTQGTASNGLVNLSDLKISTKGDSISLSFTTSLNSLNFTFEEFKSLFNNLSGDIELSAESASLKVGDISKGVDVAVEATSPISADADNPTETLTVSTTEVAEPATVAVVDFTTPQSEGDSTPFDFSWDTPNQGTAVQLEKSPVVDQLNDYTTSSYNGSKTLAELVDAIDLYPDDYQLDKGFALSDKLVTLYNYVPKRVDTTVDLNNLDFYGSFGLKHLDAKYGVTRLDLYDGLILVSNQAVKVEPDTNNKLHTLGTANPGVSQLELTLLYYLSEGSVPTSNYLKHLRHLRDFALATMYPVLNYKFKDISSNTHAEYSSLSISESDMQDNKSKAIPFATRNAMERWVDTKTGQLSVTIDQLSKITKLPESTLTQYTKALGYRPATAGNTVFDQAREMDDIGATRSHIARVTGVPNTYLTLFNGKKEEVTQTEANALPRKLFTLYMSSRRLAGFIAHLNSLTESVDDISAALQRLVSLGLILQSDAKELPSLYKFS